VPKIELQGNRVTTPTVLKSYFGIFQYSMSNNFQIMPSNLFTLFYSKFFGEILFLRDSNLEEKIRLVLF